MNIKFKCWKCDGTAIVKVKKTFQNLEIINGLAVNGDVVSNNTIVLDTEKHPTPFIQSTEEFICSVCGTHISYTKHELYDYLKRKNMLEDDEKEHPEIKLISFKPCESIYEVNGVKVRFWAIVGGTLALDLLEYGYAKRYNYCEKLDSGKHPDWETSWKGPRLSDIEGGAETLKTFVKETLPKKELRDKRHNALKEKVKTFKVTSQRFHDTANQTYVRFEIEVSRHLVPVVTCASGCYWGRAGDDCISFASEKWQKAYRFFNYHPKSLAMLEDLTDEEFEQVAKEVENLIS